MTRKLALLGVLLIGTALAPSETPAQGKAQAAQGAAQGNFCGGFGGSGQPVIQPVIYSDLHFDRSNPGFDCQAWQAFIYLNWPALNLLGTAPGTPNPNAKFGGPGATVWETYRTVDQTFLPAGADPGQWNKALPPLALVPQALAARATSGELRVLSRTSKVSRPIIENETRAAIDPAILNSITQAGGGTLYDQQSVPVYYEIALNKDQYQYIQQNGLYNANSQLTFAQKSNIALPGGKTSYGDIGALELKAAWKVLTPAEAKSGRFHTAQAIIVGAPPPRQTVTVGLVGLHFFQMLGASNQGIWATFAQEDNAPVQGAIGKGPYTFYNPNCKPAPCPINQESATPVPTQVVQIFADDKQADPVNKNMKAMLQAYKAGPWQYYKLVNVQWPQHPIPLGSAPQNEPLPYNTPPNDTDPNTKTLMNAVLETFQQTSGTSCLACHQSASVSTSQTKPVSPAPQNASSYSFMFGYAQAPQQ
ncbi:MAG TPA: hypothetical protein VK438_10745 [Xanthobacteraceae bacterium]|nr:hypothetical protein [Xanthobacteraceae bacterium]